MSRTVTLPPDGLTIRSSDGPARKVVARSPRVTDETLDTVERELVVVFADLSAALGLPRSLGQIYGLAYASPAPICFDDVVNRLALSKGSASQGIRVLRELGALRAAPGAGMGREVSGKGQEAGAGAARGARSARGRADKESAPLPLSASPFPAAIAANGGDRREYFLPETSVRALVGAVMRQRIQPPLAAGAERLARLRAILLEDVQRGKGNEARGMGTAVARGALARSAHLRQRLQSLESWHKKARAFLPFLLKLAG